MPAEEIKFGAIFSSVEVQSAWKAIEPEIQKLEIPDGTGGVNPGDRRALFYLISYFKPLRTLEIGTHIGASTVHIAAALQNRRKSDNQECPKLISLDVKDVNDPITRPWKEHGAELSPFEMIKQIGCGNHVEFVTAASLNYMVACEQKYDFIFIDGDHTAKTVYQEIPAALKLLTQNGLILLHDYFPKLKALWSNRSIIPGPCLATERLRKDSTQLSVLPLGPLPWATKLNSNLTSLALLARDS